ncbi:MAG: succinyl-diaminopimelate desuccinylase [Lysobacterales bacterium]
MSDLVEFTSALIRRRSVTPDDAGCQAIVAHRLANAGFAVEALPFGAVSNLWAVHGSGAPVLVFLGHTDVVPSGPEALWTSPPFDPVVRDGCLFGRGAADMKAGVAGMTLALERFVGAYPRHAGTLALLLTSDEEGPDNLDGTRRVAAELQRRGQRLDWCVVGEPSSRERLGDSIRVGRRGSLSGTLTVRGVQGHVAYPELAANPIHAAAPALSELAAAHWDDGDADFPPTTFQVSNIAAGTGALNVIPGTLEAHFNFRFGTASNPGSLRERVESLLRRHGLDHRVEWNLSGEPFRSPADGRLRDAVRRACRAECGVDPEESTGGGTSDGRFIAPLGAEVVEVGPVNASIHKVDEHVAIADLERLPALYGAIIEKLLGNA